jgi:alanyl-tRNA synthetase
MPPMPPDDRAAPAGAQTAEMPMKPSDSRTLNDIRRHFLDFFARNGHEIVDSGPLVPRNDPTLLFTSAGMVPFKNVFTGAETRPYTRAASAQKCLRAGGKHNDLDNVGYTARHHTFFEMLGNFSFGDYFKEEAIALAWELVTKDFALNPARLIITVYAEDDEAFTLWKKISGFRDEKIIRIPTSDNFWAMGDTGPCGPCSEIFFDYGEGVPGGPPGSPDEDGDRFVEFWNLVFMQYEQVSADERRDLPRPSIDTGMGLERMASILQGKTSNYDTDLFRTLIGATAEIIKRKPEGEAAPSFRVIADHLRAASFLIADGVLPSNEGRGYVLRRIMRRAMRHAHILGAADPLMHRLAPVLIGEMGDAYPELRRAAALITETLQLEETRFRDTLARGLRILEDETAGMKPGGVLPGEVAFRLYDTYGFPLDLTEDALRARGLMVDKAGFDKAMERQRAEARAHWAGSGEAATEGQWFALADRLGATDFLGYATEEAEGRIDAILVDGQETDTLATPGAPAMIIANQTPFYAEAGGQVGDTGTIVTEDGAIFEVTDTQKKAGKVFVHIGALKQGTLRVGDAARFAIDAPRRAAIRANHSATHLLHTALRRVLGPHVTQKGSLVAPDRLRFDFSHPKAMTADEIAAVEREVNEVIRQNAEVRTQLMATDEAVKAGALALFGENYGDEVRVLSMGDALDVQAQNRAYSVELCGGTHVARTGDIALFRIIAESAVAAGVRRVEAMTGAGAFAYLTGQEALLRQAADALKVSPADLPARLDALMQERRRLERELTEARKKLAMGGGNGAGGGVTEMEEIAGVKLIARPLAGVPPKELRSLIDAAKKQLGSGVVAFATEHNGKANVAVGVTDDLTGRFNAVELVRLAAEAVGGTGGGGRPDLAQAGGPDGARLDAAIEAIRGHIANA